MSDVYSDTYWTDEFDITEADLERIVQRMRENRSAYDLAELAKRVVRGRLRHGPEQSPATLAPWAEDPSVRLWNPAAEWSVGDHVIVAVGFPKGEHRTIHEPLVGEIILVDAKKVTVQIDTLEEPKSYVTRAESEDDLRKWRQYVEDLVEGRRGTRDIETRVEYVILGHGERVVSRLLDALQDDERFIALEGRWFLHELLEPLSEAQIEGLFRQMLDRAKPAPVADLLPLASPPLPEGDIGLFSIHAALLHEPERFENIGTPTRPLWQAVCPPPPPWERAVGAYYAYDPATFEVLLQPDQRLTSHLARRLQDLDLYDVVVKPADEP